MRNSITFWVPGEPGINRRHRINFKDRKGNPLPFPREHVDDRTAAERKNVATVAQAAMTEAGLSPFTGPLCVLVTAVFKVPVSWTRLERESCVWRTTPPDVDNILKLPMDSVGPPQGMKKLLKRLEAQLGPRAEARLASVRRASAGIIWRDDAIVVLAAVRKFYSPQIEGCLVTVEEMPPRAVSFSSLPGAGQRIEWSLEPAVRDLVGLADQPMLEFNGC